MHFVYEKEEEDSEQKFTLMKHFPDLLKTSLILFDYVSSEISPNEALHHSLTNMMFWMVQMIDLNMLNQLLKMIDDKINSDSKESIASGLMIFTSILISLSQDKVIELVIKMLPTLSCFYYHDDNIVKLHTVALFDKVIEKYQPIITNETVINLWQTSVLKSLTEEDFISSITISSLMKIFQIPTESKFLASFAEQLVIKLIDILMTHSKSNSKNMLCDQVCNLEIVLFKFLNKQSANFNSDYFGFLYKILHETKSKDTNPKL